LEVSEALKKIVAVDAIVRRERRLLRGLKAEIWIVARDESLLLFAATK
jgi:hypothetical protein